MKKILIQILISVVLAICAIYATNFISYNTIELDVDPTKCIDCITGYHSYGFPFEAIRYTSGGFTGGTMIPRAGLVVNFVIYFCVLFVIIYLISKKHLSRTVKPENPGNLGQ